MDIRATKPLSSKQLTKFHDLISKEEWDQLQEWHKIFTPWLNDESIKKSVESYKQQKLNIDKQQKEVLEQVEQWEKQEDEVFEIEPSDEEEEKKDEESDDEQQFELSDYKHASILSAIQNTFNQILIAINESDFDQISNNLNWEDKQNYENYSKYLKVNAIRSFKFLRLINVLVNHCCQDLEKIIQIQQINQEQKPIEVLTEEEIPSYTRFVTALKVSMKRQMNSRSFQRDNNIFTNFFQYFKHPELQNIKQYIEKNIFNKDESDQDDLKKLSSQLYEDTVSKTNLKDETHMIVENIGMMLERLLTDKN